MAAPQIAPLAQDFILESGMQVVITAIDATTGSTVSGVTIGNASLSVDQSLSSDTTGTEQAPPPIDPVKGAYTMGEPAL